MSSAPPSPVVVAPYRPEDALDCAELLRAAEPDAWGALAQVAPFAEFAADPANGRGCDFRLAWIGTHLAGLLVTSQDASGARAGRIVGAGGAGREAALAALIRAFEALEAGRADGELTTGEDPALVALLRERGYAERTQRLVMRRCGLPLSLPSLPGLAIRDAALPSEVEQLQAIHAAATGGDPGPDLDDLECVAAGGRVLVATIDRVVMGSVLAVPAPGGLGEVHALAVAPGAQRRGLGYALTVAALEMLARQGIATVELVVDAQNTPATSLYSRLGFEVMRRESAWTKPAAPTVGLSGGR